MTSSERVRRWREANPERNKNNNATWARDNREKCRAANARWVKRNQEKVAAKNTRWHKENSGKVYANNARYRARKYTATPAWANQEEISIFYRAAQFQRDAGLDVHVDHIVPLKSPLVCGLHVEHNIKKSNRYWPDMP